MAEIIDIADAVTAEINAGTFSQPVTAEREYLPSQELAKSQGLTVTVVPRRITSQTSGRKVLQKDYEIDIAVRKKLQTKGDQELDDLMALSEEVIEHLQLSRLATYPAAAWIGTEVRAPYSPEHLYELRQFTSVSTLTYRVIS